MSLQHRILIVEDDSNLANKFSRVLEGFGECIAVKSTSDVFYYLNFNPQVIVLDLTLFGDPIYEPKEAGIRILEKIRQLPEPDRNLPVIVVTGSSDPQVRERCKRLEIEDYLIKSHMSNEDLRTAVRKILLSRQQATQEERIERVPANVILFLAANPFGTNRVEFDREFREIDKALRTTEFRDMFDIRWFGAVRPSDLQGYLRRYKPNIVHFSGHGNQSGSIVLEDRAGISHAVPIEALSKLFSLLKGSIRCVVLNACYTEPQAQAIAKHVDCVIGMSNAIQDEAAISFATCFYEALGCGDNIQSAFELGCNQINLEDLKDQDKPRLIALRCDPASITFVKRA